MQISELRADDIPEVNELIKESKSYWDQDPEYLAEALKLVPVDEEWMTEKKGYRLLSDKGDLVGFLGYECHDDFWYLEHLWIKPDAIGESYGRQAMEYMMMKAKDAGVHVISLLPEPSAEGFYEKMGARFTTVEVPSRVKNGPVFKEMQFQL